MSFVTSEVSGGGGEGAARQQQRLGVGRGGGRGGARRRVAARQRRAALPALQEPLLARQEAPPLQVTTSTRSMLAWYNTRLSTHYS